MASVGYHLWLLKLDPFGVILLQNCRTAELYDLIPLAY